MLPKGIVATGWPATEATCRKIGIEFDDWQRDLNRAILAKDKHGLYAADTVAMSIPRQVGKTYDVGGLTFADSIINPGTTSVWTAHRFKVARESFNEMRGWAKSTLLKPHIDYDDITTAAGNECIPFRNGSRIVFAARERGAIRGFTKVRRLILDEAQILTEAALADLAPTMNQATNPQIILMGTPPKPTDPSDVWTRIRAEALDGTSDDVLYVELAAPEGSDPDDRKAWAKANPSYPKRTPAKSILRLRKLLSSEDFLREALGIWDRIGIGSPLDPTVWAERAVDASDGVEDNPDAQIEGTVALGVDVRPDRSSAAIVAAGRRADGLGLVDVIEHRPGTGWVLDRLVELAQRWDPCVLVLDPSGPAGAYEKELIERGFSTTDPGMSEWRLELVGKRAYAQACGSLVDDVINDRVRHLGQVPLDAAIASAKTRKLADAYAWDRKESGADISPLVAMTLARHGHATYGVKEPVQPWVMFA